MKPIVLSATIVLALSLTAQAAVFTDNNATVPGNQFLSHATNASFTRVKDPSAAGSTEFTRGQSFVTPDAGVGFTGWGLTAITVQMRTDNAGNAIPTTGSNPMNLRIVQWGANTQAHQPGTEIYNMSGDFPLSVSAGDFITFELGTTVALNENANYGFLLDWDTNNGRDVFFAVGNGTASTYAGGALWVGNETTMNGNQDMTFYLHGTAIPAPAALPAGLAVLGLLAARRRR